MQITTITGMSCSGKTCLERELAVHYNYGRVISTTTRSPRSGERPGHSYFFVERTEFERDLAKGLFIESLEFAGHLYGVTANEIRRMVAIGFKKIVIVCEPYGATQIAGYCRDNKIHHRPLLLKPDLEVVRPRLAERFPAPSDAVRLKQALEVEALWPAQWPDVDWELIDPGIRNPRLLASLIETGQ